MGRCRCRFSPSQEYHPWVPQVHFDTVAWCHRFGIAVTAYGSMGSSKYASQMMLLEALKQTGAP